MQLIAYTIILRTLYDNIFEFKLKPASMTITNTNEKMELEISKIIEDHNFTIYKRYRTQYNEIQQNFNMGFLTVEELMNQQLDILILYTKELSTVSFKQNK